MCGMVQSAHEALPALVTKHFHPMVQFASFCGISSTVPPTKSSNGQGTTTTGGDGNDGGDSGTTTSTPTGAIALPASFIASGLAFIMAC